MERKLIIGVIGGNDLGNEPGGSAALQMAQEVGSAIAAGGAIVLTGGQFESTANDHIKDRAILGCDGAKGSWVGVRPDQTTDNLLSGPNSLVVLTRLSPWGRDPITGAAADAIIVLQGGVGTLIEVSFAAHTKRPHIYWRSRNALRAKKAIEQATVTRKLERALREYSCLVPAPTAFDLEQILSQTLDGVAPFTNNDRDGDDATGLVAEVLRRARASLGLAAGSRTTRARTNFLGLPSFGGDPPQCDWRDKFERYISRL